ncbi:WD domain-containing protein [Rutstroemia sp. NJR-2017a WRK4]|nr:WD domain-containing protein [Rutstroemia sp. NJR-2017a WRK4]
MASILKRKRGPVDVLDTPKRTKQGSEPTPSATKFPQSNVGWDIFASLERGKELVQADDTADNGSIDDAEVIDFEDLFAPPLPEPSNEPQNLEMKQTPIRPKSNKKLWERTIPQAPKPRVPGWMISDSVGGRIINAEPVFAKDEKSFILAHRMSLLVYSTSNSLLTRTIKFDPSKHPLAHIVAYELSPTEPSIVWVALSDGAIYRVDWTLGVGNDQSWRVSSTGCIHMTVASMLSAGRRRDVLFTTEEKKDGGWRITANELTQPGSPIQTVARTIHNSKSPIYKLKTAKEGSVILAVSGKSVLVGNIRSLDFNTTDKLKYEFRVFQSADTITSFDIRVSNRTGNEDKRVPKKIPVADIVVGDAKGAIFVHRDLLANLILSEDKSNSSRLNLTPAKFHWHRKVVNTVKWSLDGNYIISGGDEAVLVLWQLDTGKKEFLPYMTTPILNLVVSPSGTSYGIQLADNSALVLSTAELEPTANIAGIQSSVTRFAEPRNLQVKRLKADTYRYPMVQRTPAVLNPLNPSQLLLGVGPIQEIPLQGAPTRACLFLQTYDISAGHNVSRQALARTNVSNNNTTPNSLPISEPRVTHIQISHDGLWLATVDEWTPPLVDLDFIRHQATNYVDELSLRREVYLKFWKWKDASQTWELVSRINTPHAQSSGRTGAGRILDLSSDPDSLQFATIGEDRVVRTWSPKTRMRDGVSVKDEHGHPLQNWHCRHAIHLAKSELAEDSLPLPPQNGCVAFAEDGSTLAAAYGDNGIVHILDPESGTIKTSQCGLYEGHIVRMEILGRDLVTLSNSVRVHDLVADEMRYSFTLSIPLKHMNIAQKVEMMHLAIDRKSHTFAVAIPMRLNPPTTEERKSRTQPPTYSALAVFGQDSQVPYFTECFDTLLTALVPAVDMEGYLAIDGAAEIRSVTKKGVQSAITLAQSTADLHLDTIADEPVGDLLQMVEDDEEEPEEAQPPSPLAIEEENETPVVTQQELSEVFDIGPAFALPPLEEMFYQVAGLFSSKPLERVA